MVMKGYQFFGLLILGAALFGWYGVMGVCLLTAFLHG